MDEPPNYPTLYNFNPGAEIIFLRQQIMYLQKFTEIAPTHSTYAIHYVIQMLVERITKLKLNIN